MQAFIAAFVSSAVPLSQTGFKSDTANSVSAPRPLSCPVRRSRRFSSAYPAAFRIGDPISRNPRLLQRPTGSNQPFLQRSIKLGKGVFLSQYRHKDAPIGLTTLEMQGLTPFDRASCIDEGLCEILFFPSSSRILLLRVENLSRMSLSALRRPYIRPISYSSTVNAASPKSESSGRSEDLSSGGTTGTPLIFATC